MEETHTASVLISFWLDPENVLHTGALMHEGRRMKNAINLPCRATCLHSHKHILAKCFPDPVAADSKAQRIQNLHDFAENHQAHQRVRGPFQQTILNVSCRSCPENAPHNWQRHHSCPSRFRPGAIESL